MQATSAAARRLLLHKTTTQACVAAAPAGRQAARHNSVVATYTATPGVNSIGITGDLKDRLEVVGEGIDVTCLVMCLRKKLCHAEILQVEEVKDKKPEDKKKPEEPKPKPCTCPGPCWCAAGYCPPPLPMVLCEEPPAGACSIM
ncbi:hypothetical protein HU200_027573 [Digitaria exilis]|uniref:Uncharacterized protein n=1 Tax=Digitaria exilis TaxID=1010633 RepID=A0A835BWN8_9POAL|nr:hypothetical protein HU200_027573 [Digitaria exilis]